MGISTIAASAYHLPERVSYATTPQDDDGRRLSPALDVPRLLAIGRLLLDERERHIVVGFPSTGDADFSAENGKGSTPRKGAGLIAIVTAATPSPASICAMSPPKE